MNEQYHEELAAVRREALEMLEDGGGEITLDAIRGKFLEVIDRHVPAVADKPLQPVQMAASLTAATVRLHELAQADPLWRFVRDSVCNS